MATTCMARTVVNQGRVDNHLHRLINEPQDPVFCGSASLTITGCFDGSAYCATIENDINACLYDLCANGTARICLDDLCVNGTINLCIDDEASNAVIACNAAVIGACNVAGTRIAASNNGVAVAVATAACNAAAIGACATAGRNARTHRITNSSGK